MKKIILMAAVLMAAAGAAKAGGWDGNGGAVLPGISVIKELAAKSPFPQAPAVEALPAARTAGPLARLTVCPKDQNLIKSETVTLTPGTITFDLVSGPWNLNLKTSIDW